jgi:hypothetical protein
MSRVVVLPVLHSSGEVHKISVPADTPLHELHKALSDGGYHRFGGSAPKRHPEKPGGKGSKAENVRQPRSGELVKSLRQTGVASRPSNDSWPVNTEEPKRS